MSEKGLSRQSASAAADGLLRMHVRQFSDLMGKGDLDQCRKELESRPGLFEALEDHTRMAYALSAMSLPELRAEVRGGRIDATSHLATMTDLMCMAASYARVDVMQWLWEERQTFRHDLPALAFALSEACTMGQLESARWLLDVGVSASDPAGDGAGFNDSPLGAAAYSGNPELIELLLQRGADPNVPHSGYYPMLLAVRHGKSALEPLLRAGADPERRLENSDIDMGVLAFAVVAQTKSGDEGLEYLLAAGVDPLKHHDALLAAAENGHCAAVARLLDLGLDADFQGRADRVSALMLASQRKHSQIVDLLLQQGADPNLLDREGRSALALAVNAGDLPVADRLIAAGASAEAAAGKRSFWQHISKQTPEIKRHIRAQLLAKSVEAAMPEADEAPAKRVRFSGMSPL